jgi:hypothetical protein
MTGNDAPPTVGAPGGPPWPVELLADLHAGVFDDKTAAELRSQVDADPEARAVLAALDATRAELAHLPLLRMPDDVAARLDAAVRGEATARAAAGTARAAAGTAAGVAAPQVAPAAPSLPASASPASAAPAAPVIDLAAARERRRRRGLVAGATLLAAAAATVGIVAVSGLTGGPTTGTPVAGPTGVSDLPLPPVAVSSDNLAAAYDEAVSKDDYGPLAAAGRLDACLSAIRLDPATAKPLGAREVTLDGRPGVLLVLPTGTAARFRLLVVSPDCGAGNAAVLADATIGR